MPSDEYTSSTIRGSLKLKGRSKPEGVKKKKKKSKPSVTDGESSALQKAVEEEDTLAAGSSKDVAKSKRKEKERSEEGEEELDEERLRELDPRGGDGKTASERAYEEMRRKRVCPLPHILIVQQFASKHKLTKALSPKQLQERIQKEGPKTHKQRVEELNKYLSNLSEHHDMYDSPRVLYYSSKIFGKSVLTHIDYVGRRLDLDNIRYGSIGIWSWVCILWWCLTANDGSLLEC